jgi:signal transduction histidine kinase
MKFEGSELLIVFSSLIILMVLIMMILIYVGFLRKKTQMVMHEQDKELKFAQELALSQIEMREQTLRYIGQELHDDIGQKLSVAKLLNNKLYSILHSEEKEYLKEINDLLGECISDIRNLSKTFIADHIEHLGLVESIEREVKRIKKLDFMSVNFIFNNHDIDINPKHCLILFRMVQECLNNVLKHSKSKKLEIILDDRSETLEIRIIDHGVGIPKNVPTNGSGLRNITNRAKIINADFFISSELNDGTEIKIIYPKP